MKTVEFIPELFEALFAKHRKQENCLLGDLMLAHTTSCRRCVLFRVKSRLQQPSKRQDYTV